jgi:dihydroxy-acid dehydratase
VIILDVAARRLDVDLPEDELEAREPASGDSYAAPVRGWERLYVDHVLQADKGADLDFLTGSSGSEVRRESH